MNDGIADGDIVIIALGLIDGRYVGSEDGGHDGVAELGTRVGRTVGTEDGRPVGALLG